MTSSIIANLEKLLDGPRDGAMLRQALGNEWLKAGDPGQAAQYFRDALKFDARYSAAWKLLGKALEASGEKAAALDAYRRGAEVATTRGDLQAAKEMQVFARRLQRQNGNAAT